MTTTDSTHTSKIDGDLAWAVDDLTSALSNADVPTFLDAEAHDEHFDARAQIDQPKIGPTPELPPNERSERPTRVVPLPLGRRLVSGSYRGASAAMELQLRIDVDGPRPMRCVSGDFFQRSGATVRYLGSFLTESLTSRPSQNAVMLDGDAAFSFPTPMKRVRIAIPRQLVLGPQMRAIVRFFSATGVLIEGYLCSLTSRLFRRVEFEHDFVARVNPFTEYDTGLLQSGGRRRTLTIVSAFAEAGVELIPTEGAGEVPIDDAGTDGIWSNSELHASMEQRFSRFSNTKQFGVYLLGATRHEIGLSLRGIMFDQEGAPRQGCAVFHDAIGNMPNPPPVTARAQLRTCVHELGHCFNLFHSFHKEFMQPPQPNRLDALSWMHYPANYLGPNGSGETAYWAAFPFQFDDLEVAHLRHAFRENVVMGGNPFGAGAADLGLFAEPVKDDSGLKLDLRLPQNRGSYRYGEPVVVELKLETTDRRGLDVNEHLHPNLGFLQLAIMKPNGSTVRYRPLLEHCADASIIRLGDARPSTYKSAYIGFGKDGVLFRSARSISGARGLHGGRRVTGRVSASHRESSISARSGR